MKSINRQQLKEEIIKILKEEKSRELLKVVKDGIGSILLFARQDQRNTPSIQKWEKKIYSAISELEKYI